MGAVRDRLKIDLLEAKTFMRVDADEDDKLIEDLIDAAKEQADLYLNNDFESVYREYVGRGDGSAVAFTVSKVPLYRVSAVYVNGMKVGTPTSENVNKATGVVTLAVAPEDGARVEISYEADLPIPAQVRTWVLSKATRAYERRVNGLASESDPLGSRMWREVEYEDIARYRRNPGF